MSNARAFSTVIALVLWGAPAAPVEVGDILPADVTYDSTIPTPRQVLGFEVGDWHVRHDQLVRYLEILASASDRVMFENQGRTHEGRPLPLLTVSAPENLRRIGEIREAHLLLSDPDTATPGPGDRVAMPVVVWLGYSIHGNEASGANASLLVAYYLAAARSSEVEEILRQAVVLLDPSLNPDGLGRFASWANTHRGEVLMADPNHREHRESWPGGRTNHYWFDLNRDWLLLQHPESRARIETRYRWRPNLVGDYHEMGSDATYFFQPGVQTRVNPLIPQGNVELTRRIARYHAEALESARSLYFTKERFDDFYPGKGSTYPDLTGSVGILFEQASVRGHLRETRNGTLSFPAAIRNQFLTSLSMLRAGRDLRQDLLTYQAEFFRTAASEAKGWPIQAYVFGLEGDSARAFHMLEILRRHRIQVHELAQPVSAGKVQFEPGTAWVVPADQPQFRLIRSLFETITEFEDSTFYDVSTWSLPLSFGARSAGLDRRSFSGALLGDAVDTPELPRTRLPEQAEVYAYLIDWRGYYAPRALNRLLEAGVRVRVATRPLEADTDRGPRHFGYGTLVVPTGLAADGGDQIRSLMEAITRQDGAEVYAVSTGMTRSGVDLGSPNLIPLEKPRPLLLVGRGVSGYEAGEIWHLLDFRFRMPVSLVETSALSRIDLAVYTHLLMVDGSYSDLSDATVERVRRWVREGGCLVASKRAARWVEQTLFEPREPTESQGSQASSAAQPEAPPRAMYAQFEQDRAAQRISSAILEVELDTTHPLAFGYTETKLPVFRNSTLVLEASRNPYENVAFYTETPLLSGYISPERLNQVASGVAMIAGRLGRGAVIRLADDPNFRGFWYGTNKIYLNAIFFGPLIKETSPQDQWQRGGDRRRRGR